MELIYGLALSLHIGFEGEYNYIHPHIGVDYNNFIAGAYYNSESNISTFAGYKLDFTENTSVELGAVTGYSDAEIAPMVKLNYKQFYISPGVDDGNVGIVTGIDWRF